jgi:hypothetical protein
MGIKEINNSGYNHENLELMIELEDADVLRNTTDFTAIESFHKRCAWRLICKSKTNKF